MPDFSDSFIELLNHLPDDHHFADVLLSCLENSELDSFSLMSQLLETDVNLLFAESVLAMDTGEVEWGIECCLTVLMSTAQLPDLNSESISEYLQALPDNSEERQLLCQVLGLLKQTDEFQSDIKHVERQMGQKFQPILVTDLVTQMTAILKMDVYSFNFLSGENLSLFMSDSLDLLEGLSISDETVQMLTSERRFTSLQTDFFRMSVQATLEGDEDLMMQASDEYMMGVVQLLLISDTPEDEKTALVQFIKNRFGAQQGIEAAIRDALLFNYFTDIFATAVHMPTKRVYLRSLFSALDESDVVVWAAYYSLYLSQLLIDSELETVRESVRVEFPSAATMESVGQLMVRLMAMDMDDSWEASSASMISELNGGMTLQADMVGLADHLSSVFELTDPDVISLLMLLTGDLVPEWRELIPAIPEEDRAELLSLLTLIKIDRTGFSPYLSELICELSDTDAAKGVLKRLVTHYPYLEKIVRKGCV